MQTTCMPRHSSNAVICGAGAGAATPGGNALPPSRDGDVAAHLQSPLVLTALTT
jgi:hypothetical protein